MIVEADMRTHLEFRRTHLSPGLAAILGLLLLAANIVVDVSTSWPAAKAEIHSVQDAAPKG